MMRVLAAALVVVLCAAAAGCGANRAGEPQAPKEWSAPTGGAATTSAESTPAEQVPPLPVGNVLSNSGFEAGLAGWEVWDQRPERSPGNNVIETARWEERGGQVLHITRTSERDGGASGVIQRPGIDVAGARSVVVKYLAYVNYEEGGNVGGGDPRWFPEGAAQVRVYYTAADGSKQEWYHGICIAPMENYDREHFTVTEDNVWTPYESPNLMELTPPPVRIDEIRFYGFGWGFDAMMDDCFLIVER